ncbi:aminopeptidase P N-terminal domain-containing protein [Bacteroidota bacterium]
MYIKLLVQISLIVFFYSNPIMAQADNEHYKYPFSDGIHPEKYQERREKVLNEFSNNSVILFLSADFYLNIRDYSSKSLLSPNLYYLTGMPPQKAALLLIPGGIGIDGNTIHEILFVKNQTRNNIKWNGINMSADNAEKILQIEKAKDFSMFDSLMKIIFTDNDTLYIDKPVRTKHFSSDENGSECDVEPVHKIKNNFPGLMIKENIPLLSKMRRIKDKDEIKLIQKAVDISIEGHKAAMKAAKPGIIEYQLQAEMEYQFMKNGSERPAYGSIVGGGLNTCFLHYQKNQDTIHDGDLVLMDCGAKYHGYCADITRTFPVSGSFTIEQKIIYNIVLEAMDSAFSVCKPGIEFKEIHAKAKEVIKNRLIEQSIINDPEEVKDYFPHSTSHFLGLNVHDVGTGGILESGIVLTIEPGIYIPDGSPCDKRWWNIGIRIEDDVLITEDGYINLSEKLARKPEEIEMLMK